MSFTKIKGDLITDKVDLITDMADLITDEVQKSMVSINRIYVLKVKVFI